MSDVLTKISYTAGNNQTVYSIPFLSIDNKHILVYVNDTQITTGYTIDGQQLTFDSAPVSGSKITIKRQTPLNQRLVTWVNAKGITAEDLNLEALQFLFLIQEIASAGSLTFRVNNKILQVLIPGNTDYVDLYDFTDIKGADGSNGSNGLSAYLQINDDGYLQWKQGVDGAWVNLFDMSLLKGDKGDQGTSSEVEFRVSGGYIQWCNAAIAADAWHNLIALTDLTSGIQNGVDGKTPVFQVAGGYIQYRYADTEAWQNLVALSSITGATGAAGSPVQIQVANDYIQWKLESSASWTNLVSIASLKGSQGEQGVQGIQGPQGNTGSAGADGRKVILGLSSDSTYITWKYDGDSTATNLVKISSLVGPQGAQGDYNDMQVADGYIQYKQHTGTVWTNLVALSTLTSGLQNGVNGKEIELQSDGTYIQWRYSGTTAWTNLVSIASLKGSQGEQGPTGPQGVQGIQGLPGKDGKDGVDGNSGVNGTDGREIELVNDGTYVKWRYTGDAGYSQLIALSALKGAAGANGKDVQLQKTDTYVQWRLGDTGTWVDLIALADLKGEQGIQGIQGLKGDKGDLPDKASGAEIVAGTDDAKYTSSKAIKDATNVASGLCGLDSAAKVPMNNLRISTIESTVDTSTLDISGYTVGDLILQLEA